MLHSIADEIAGSNHETFSSKCSIERVRMVVHVRSNGLSRPPRPTYIGVKVETTGQQSGHVSLLTQVGTQILYTFIDT
jgi:hypothetical protein